MNAAPELNLPRDLVEYLTSGGGLTLDTEDSEAGILTLHPLADLRLGTANVDSNESPLKADDPHAGESGSYEVPAVSLTAFCEAYDPEGILLWLPNEELFGSWDNDHYDLFVFPGATWDTIIRNPVPYVDTQWDTDRQVGQHFRPYPQYPFTTR